MTILGSKEVQVVRGKQVGGNLPKVSLTLDTLVKLGLCSDGFCSSPKGKIPHLEARRLRPEMGVVSSLHSTITLAKWLLRLELISVRGLLKHPRALRHLNPLASTAKLLSMADISASTIGLLRWWKFLLQNCAFSEDIYILCPHL